MPKKSGKKCPTTGAVAVVEAGEEKNPCSTTPTKKQKPRDEIDEIFASKKRKKPADQEDGTKKKKQQQPPVKDGEDKMIKKNKSKKIPNREIGSGSRKRTKDGFAIYTEDELGIGKADAGGTPLCPFDCDCCF